ncbi:hypothetical protein D039_0506B, partial [Vibrio parahaemolyticus EKP-028]
LLLDLLVSSRFICRTVNERELCCCGNVT